MELVDEHGAAVVALCIDEEGQARTAEWKVRVAERLIEDLTDQPRHARVRHRRRHPDLPDHHRAGGGAPRRARDHRGDPRAQAPPPRCADHAGRLQRLVRAQRRRAAGAELGVPARVRERRASTPAIVSAAKILPMAKIPDEQRSVALDLVYDRRALRCRPALRPAQPVHGAVRGRLGVVGEGRAGPRSWPRCRCSSGWSGGSSTASGSGLEADLDAALASRPALEIINDTLLAGMKTVGELFGVRARCSCRSCSRPPK